MIELDVEDMALLRRLATGLQDDLHRDGLVPLVVRRRVADARTMLAIVKGRHPEVARAGTRWRIAVDHVEDLCAELERKLAHLNPGGLEV
jgi:hypothetical protein